MRAGGVKAGVAAGAHMYHRGDLVLDHLLVYRIPLAVTQWGRGPVASRRIRIQIDAYKNRIP